MRYPISKISKIVGISSEAVRLYEKKGVVHSQKNPQNGYRSFHTLDIGTLLRCRTYAQLGLSLNEAADLINAADVADVHARLGRQEKALEREMEKCRRYLNRLQDLNGQILRCQGEVGSFRVENHPGLYHLDYRNNERILDDEERMALYPQWASWVPLSFVSLRFPLEGILQGGADYYGGFGVMEEDAHFLGISASHLVRCFPAHLSLRTILCIPGERRIMRRDIQSALDNLLSSGYRVGGDPFTRMIVTVNRNRPEFVRYYEMWIPIDRNLSYNR